MEVVRRNIQVAVGPGPMKRLRRCFELECSTLLYDLLCYGAGTELTISPTANPNIVPEDHWFSLFRRYVRNAIQASVLVCYASYVHF